MGSDLHQSLPVSILHELGVELGDEWQDGVHVLHSIVQGLEGLPGLDVLVLRALWVALLGLHLLDQGHELLSINFVPKG